ncbi:MAG: DedA family protein [Thermodesulfovibrionales bacterium]|nr:DedA family protein [Thermodesulfovibrionales bacterium]
MEEFLQYLVKTIGALGYPGIFLLMAIESTVIPLPSELVMPPAGYLAAKNEMNIFGAIVSGTLGSLAGAYINYFISYYFGRPFFIRYGKYFFFSEKKLKKIENFFTSHGEISVFTGRLLPVARHLISIPAGLAGMNHVRFSFYTILGAGIWVSVLTYIGYFIGENEELIKKYSSQAGIGAVIFVLFIIAIYIIIQKKRA